MTASRTRIARIGLGIALVLMLIGGSVVVLRSSSVARTTVTAYFPNSDGIFAGDEVRIIGFPVGKIDKIEPEPLRVKITFWFDAKYKVPADASAVILSPSLVTSRAIQLTPVFTGGPVMRDGAVLDESRTAVPVAWDDFREQLQRLSDTLQPTGPGGVSTLGAFINTAADNLRGQGPSIRDSVIKLSQAFSILGDHSKDIFSSIKNLSILVSGLQGSAELMKQLNQNLADVTGQLADDPGEVAQAVSDLNTAVGEVQGFVAGNRESIGVTSDKLASITTAVRESIDDVEQALHLAPSTLSNFVNIWQPAQGALTGALAVNNFADPISFICGAIQAASRLGAEQSAKLCVQYLAPIVKNRQYNFPPIGLNPFVGGTARPNELTYSEDWMRPDFVPPAAAPPPAPPPAAAPLPAEATATDPSKGLPGLMVPSGGGS